MHMMRSRQEIVDGTRISTVTRDQEPITLQRAILEVLLDIREQNADLMEKTRPLIVGYGR